MCFGWSACAFVPRNVVPSRTLPRTHCPSPALQLDYYDVSLEILAVYLQSFPASAVAVNLKACNHFRLYNGGLQGVVMYTCPFAVHSTPHTRPMHGAPGTYP